MSVDPKTWVSRDGLEAPEMLRDRGRLLYALYRDLPEAVVITDANRCVVDANPAFARTFGYALDEIVGKSLAVLYAHVEEFERRHKSTFDVSGEGSSAIQYTRLQRQDGSVFLAGFVGVRLRDASDNTIGHAGLIHDLTEKEGVAEDQGEVMERAVAERDDQVSTQKRTPAMMHSIDADGFIRSVSDQWLKRLGYREDQVIGRRSTEFLTEESRAYAVEVVLPEFWKKGYCERVPYTFLTSAGMPVDVELSATLDTTSGERRTLAILHDVSDRNRAIRMLEERNTNLRQFTQIASHDLQAPLRHISLFSEMLSEELDAGDLDSVRSTVDSIQTSTARLSDMVRALMEYTRVGDKVPRCVITEFGKIVQRAVKKLRPQLDNSGVRLEIEPLPAVECDPELMESVVSKLLSNAITFVAPERTPHVVIAGECSDETVCLSVTDNGIGIPAEFRERVFEPLKRLHGPDSEYPGTGIGLALCRRIVEAHGGAITVSGGQEHGSRFTIELPRTKNSGE